MYFFFFRFLYSLFFSSQFTQVNAQRKSRNVVFSEVMDTAMMYLDSMLIISNLVLICHHCHLWEQLRNLSQSPLFPLQVTVPQSHPILHQYTEYLSQHQFHLTTLLFLLQCNLTTSMFPQFHLILLLYQLQHTAFLSLYRHLMESLAFHQCLFIAVWQHQYLCPCPV